jgi:hypothetical protein
MRARWGLVALAIASTAHADPAADLFTQGRALLEQGKAAEACGKFEAALKLEPDAAGVLLNLGLCNVQQHKLATALDWFRQAESLATRDHMSEVATAARQQITTLSSLVPTIVIDAPVGAAVAVDGSPVATGQKIEIDAGHHIARMDGGVTQPFDVEESASAKAIVLRRPEPVTPVVVEPSHRTAWIVGGAGAGLVAGSVALGFVGKSKFDGTHDLDTRQHWKSVLLYGGTTMFAAGCVVIAAAAYLYVRENHTERTIVAPIVAPDRAGIAITGAF